MRKSVRLSLPLLFFLSVPTQGFALQRVQVIRGSISPKSVVYSGNGLFFAQNMMYRHTITVYNRSFELVKTIPDRVRLADFGHIKYRGLHRGAPVEAAFSHGGRFAWVSNYNMYGRGFGRPGHDKCRPAQKKDVSFVYRIDTSNMKIVNAIAVGSVPKFLASTPDDRLVLVSNWCTYDLSVIDTAGNREIRRIRLGAYPRGIAVSPDSGRAYVAVMGSYDLAVVDLRDFTVGWIRQAGRSPRHLNIAPDGRFLYATLNGEGRVAKIDIASGRVLHKTTTGRAPRSMVIDEKGEYLYVVNYYSNTVSQVRCRDMKEVAEVSTGVRPIGITYDPVSRRIWVACYSGSIIVYQI